MTELERVLVQAFNAFFEKNGIKGIAYRLKQHRFTSQALDVLVDSLNPDFYIGIECKSISVQKGANALYFTQHFGADRNGKNQVERESEFLRRSGRRGFLVVELKYGTGRQRRAYVIPWYDLLEKFNRAAGFKIQEIEGYPEIPRHSTYIIEKETWIHQP